MIIYFYSCFVEEFVLRQNRKFIGDQGNVSPLISHSINFKLKFILNLNEY